MACFHNRASYEEHLGVKSKLSRSETQIKEREYRPKSRRGTEPRNPEKKLVIFVNTYINKNRLLTLKSILAPHFVKNTNFK